MRTAKVTLSMLGTYWKVKAFRKVFIWFYQPCSAQASLGYPFTHWRETHRPWVQAQMSDDIYRCWLSFALELCSSHESSSVWLEAWNEVRWTIPAASCQTVSLSTALKHTRRLPKGSSHTAHISHAAYMWPASKDQISMVACPDVTQLWLLCKSYASDRNINFCCSICRI